LIRDVIDQLPRRTIGTVKRQLTFENLESVIDTNNSDDISRSATASTVRKHEQAQVQEHEPPPLEVQAIYLLAPIVFQVVGFWDLDCLVLFFSSRSHAYYCTLARLCERVPNSK
jgi:hypothetical protein